MTGLLESGVRKPFICLGPTTEVSPHSAGNEEVPRVWPFNATDKLDPDIRELLSMHCSWCVLDCGEAQMAAVHQPSHIRQPLPPSPCRISSAFRSCSGKRPQDSGIAQAILWIFWAIAFITLAATAAMNLAVTGISNVLGGVNSEPRGSVPETDTPHVFSHHGPSDDSISVGQNRRS